MKRHIVLALILLFLSTSLLVAQAAQNKPLTNADVIKMVKAGLDDNTIVLAIKNRSAQFDTSPDALIDLKTQGVSQNVIHAMLGAGTPAATPVSATPSGSGDGSGTPGAGKWRLMEDKSAFDDTKTVSLLVPAEAEISGPVKSFLPRLIVRCKERDTSVYVATGMAASVEYGTDTHRVRLRIDDGKTTVDAWSEATSNDALFAPQSVVFLKQLVAGKRLAFEFVPFDGPPQVAQFDIGGLGPLLAGTRDACGWDMIFESYGAAGSTGGSGAGSSSTNAGPPANPSCPIAISKVEPFAVIAFAVHPIQLKVTYQNTTQKEIVTANFGGTFYDSSFQKSLSSDAFLSKDRVKPGETKTTGMPNTDMHKKVPGVSNRKGEVYLLKMAFADGSTWEDNGSKSCRGRNW